LRRVDGFLKTGLKASYPTREGRAAKVAAADKILKGIVDKLKRRGLNHPFVKNFVLARCNPLTRARKNLPDFDQALGRLLKALEAFDVEKIRQEDIARSAAMRGPASS
jgi:ParB family chromosome partitioning protein